MNDIVWLRPLENADFRVCVLGTSISWGQGLLPGEKACVVAAKALAQMLGRNTPAVASYAQSGAKLWPASARGRGLTWAGGLPMVGEIHNFLEDNELEWRTKTTLRQVPRSATAISDANPGELPYYNAAAARNVLLLDGEIPSPAPYIWDQAEAAKADFAAASARPDLVWLDAGGNDVGFIEAVLFQHSLVRPGAQKIWACVKNMRKNFKNLLQAIALDNDLGGCPIVVTGYYHAVTELTFADGTSLDTPWRFADWLAAILQCEAWQLFNGDWQDEIIKNMGAFVNCLNGEWANVCAELRKQGLDVRFVDPLFPAEGGMFVADTSLIWPNPKPPFDSLARLRPDSHWYASFAHPNVQGAAQFASRVLDVFTAQV